MSDQVWSKRCHQEFNAKVPPSKGITRLFFKEILHNFGQLLGLWTIHADCYGGLLLIKYQDFKLLGVELQLPKDPHITDPLRSKTVFVIELAADTEASIRCSINPNKPHRCTLTYGDKKTPHHIIRRCQEGIDSDDHQITSDSTHELQRWLSEQSDFTEEFGLTRSQCIYKYLVLRQIEMTTHYSRLVLPSSSFHVPIKPGLFKGTYSAHGLELVSLFYEGDGNKVTALKITGDPNVPAGKVTFRADLPYCMYLTESQQTKIEDLQQFEPVMSEQFWNELPSTQPFVKPLDCVDSYRNIPSTCQSRFHGFGQIAGDGFTRPKFIPGHWIIFNQDLFGFLWLDLHSLSVFHRVNERQLQ